MATGARQDDPMLVYGDNQLQVFAEVAKNGNITAYWVTSDALIAFDVVIHFSNNTQTTVQVPLGMTNVRFEVNQSFNVAWTEIYERV